MQKKKKLIPKILEKHVHFQNDAILENNDNNGSFEKELNKFNFLTSFGEIVCNGPLNHTETISMRKTIESLMSHRTFSYTEDNDDDDNGKAKNGNRTNKKRYTNNEDIINIHKGRYYRNARKFGDCMPKPSCVYRRN